MNKELKYSLGGLSLRCSVKRNRVCLFCVFVIALFASGCEVPEAEALGAADLRVAVPVGVEAAPLIVALESGFIEGASVELVPVSGPKEMETLLQSGALDGGAASLFSLVRLQEQGFLVLAASVTAADYMLVTAAGETESIADSVGKIAVSEETFEQYLLGELLELQEPVLSELEYYPTPSSVQALQAFEQKKAAQAFLPRHLGEEALREGAVLVASTLEHDLPGFVLLFSGEALQDKADAIQSFYQGYFQALELLNSGPIPDLSFLVEKWGYPEWWQEGISGAFALPRRLGRDEANDALAWYKVFQELEAVPVYEGLIWREQFWE